MSHVVPTVPAGNRRFEVATALDLGTSEKMALVGKELPELERAYSIASSPPPLGSPWPQLAAYRLAHAVARLGTDDAARRAAGLLEEAATSAFLGPWPQVFRLALLHRLGAPRAELEAVYRAAIASQQTWRAEHGGQSTLFAGSLHSESYNLLVLSAYGFGLDFAPLRGFDLEPARVVSPAGITSQVGWALYDGTRESARVVLSESFAMAERDGLAAGYPGAWVLTLGPASGPSLSGAGRSEPVPLKEAGLLALLLRGNVRGATAMMAALWDDDDESDNPSARYRQTVSRLRRRLRTSTGDPALAIEEVDQVLVLRTSVRVFAVVHLPTLTNLGQERRRVALP